MGSSLKDAYGDRRFPGTEGAACTTGSCSAFGPGPFDWGYNISPRLLNATQATDCSGSGAIYGAAQEFYNPCDADTAKSAAMDSAAACAARQVATWDDVTIPEPSTVNYVDTVFYAGPTKVTWNTNWDLRGDVALGSQLAYPVTNVSSRRLPRMVYGVDFQPPGPTDKQTYGTPAPKSFAPHACH